MSDSVIGVGVIKTVVDNTELKVGIDDAKRTVKSLGNEIGSSVAEGANKAARSVDAYIQKLELSASTVGKSAREIKLLELTQRGATEAQLKAADAAMRTIEAHRLQQAEIRKTADTQRTAAAIATAAQTAHGNSMKLSVFQAQQLSYQLNDLFVQLASPGVNPMTALIQQGSQLNGTFGGFAGTLRAIGTLFTTTRVLIGGAAAAVGGLIYAFKEGHDQSVAFERALDRTGNAAGLTEGRFNALAMSISENTRTTIGSSRETLQALVSSGKFSGGALSETAKAVQLFSKVTGSGADDVIKDMLNMTDGVAKFAEGSNRAYHFLSAEQLKYIKTLEDQGNAQKAIEVAMEAFNARFGKAAENVGALERAWSGVKRAASSAWDAMLNVGRDTTLEDRIASTEAALRAIGERRSTNPALTEARKAVLQEQLDAIRETLRLQGRSADISAGTAQAEQAKVKFNQLLEQSMTKQQKMAKEIADANALADRAGASPTDRTSILTGIRERYKELDLSKPTLDLDIKKIEAQLGVLTNSYKNAESIMEATRSAGLMSEKEYYDAKRSFLTLNTDAQVRALEKENALLTFQKATGKEAIDNQKKVAENQAKITELKAEAAAKGIVLDTQQATAIRQVSRAYDEARIAAQDYLDTLTRQQGRELDAFARGDKERTRLAARQQIEDRYNQQRLDLENNKRLLEGLKDSSGKSLFNDDARKRYDIQLEIINEFQGKSLEGWDKHYADISDKEANWSNGASRAIENYSDNARNAMKQTEGLFTKSFQSMEDSVVEFVMTGKASFSDLAQSIVADLIRIEIQKNAAGIFGAIGSYLGIGSSPTPADYSQLGVGLPTLHTGGIVGMERTSTKFVRDFPSDAPRYHSGGIAGDEVRAILRRGEGVFTQAQMRNLAPTGSAKTQVNVKIINNSSNQVTTRETQDGGIEVLIDAVDNAIAERIGSGVGSTNTVLQSRFGLRPQV